MQVKNLWNESIFIDSFRPMVKASSNPGRSETSQRASRRSPCPVACSLDILGDRWTLLIIRDLFLGRNRFKDFIASPEGIPTNILSERLERLQRHGILKQMPAPDGSKRLAYELTAKGRALGPMLTAIRDWGLAWEKGTKVLLEARPEAGT
jgi:DNA-binding HxlR family transcriptional regulator